LVLYGVCGLAATFSILQWFAKGNMSGVVVLLFCGAAWIGIQHLGYAEFSLARRIVTAATFRNTVSAQLQIKSLETSLDAADSMDDCFALIREASLKFDFVEIRLQVCGEVWQERLRAVNGDARWHLRIPLGTNDYINFTRLNDSSILPMGVAPFMDVIQRTMTAKCGGKPALKVYATRVGANGRTHARSISTPIDR
jgi:UDP-GlcNAc:undecaprenyl-phosphate/decaprenyl-phosphate GlcNAc-1-phosphate transferase